MKLKGLITVGVGVEEVGGGGAGQRNGRKRRRRRSRADLRLDTCDVNSGVIDYTD